MIFIFRKTLNNAKRFIQRFLKYIVYKYVNGKAVRIGEVTKTSVKITGLKPDTEYSCIISAVIDGEETVRLKRDVITVRTMKENDL